ncbi:MAG: nucleotidyl transferase AbiEii/AbiGii toxin family protein [Candidatus Heimdallarchaeota archaeon]
MAPSGHSLISIHEDTDFFREAVLFTAAQSGLGAALVEKDYFCSVLLDYFYQNEQCPLVFRGGTCLSKIYADFYRLSEDLDFVISIASDASRSKRSRTMVPVKEWVAKIPDEISGFELLGEMKGHNNSTQYIATVTYSSKAGIADELTKIKIEVGLREELLHSAVIGRARTLLMDPFKRITAVPEFDLITMTLLEAYAEKLRAALTRRDPAVRDFYDVDYAAVYLNLDLKDPSLTELVMKKLKVPGNDPIDISPSRKVILEAQLETQLKSVLRPQDFEKFDLDRAFGLVAEVGSAVLTEE